MIKIRKENPSDISDVRKLNDSAFIQPQEGSIVDKLREKCNEILSLVAVHENKIVGHILFSPVTIEGKTKNIKGMGLAPMAVLPELQNQGIGSKLVMAGLDEIKRTACPFIIVLGHEKYYPRFGFVPASKYGVRCQWENVPDGVFMIMILNKKEFDGFSGTAKYREEFNEAV